MNTYQILFDDQCTLCNRFKQGLEYFSQGKVNLKFFPLSSPETFERFSTLKQQDCRDTVHMIDEAGIVYRGPEVVAELVKVLPATSKLAWLLEKDIGQKATALFYHKVNEYRKKCKKCGQKKKGDKLI